MIEINGSEGGQVLRTALALSALTQTPTTVNNIREKRPTTGLRPQHLAGLKTIAKICNAKISGDKISSTRVSFIPEKISPINLTVNVGTAGSLSLLLQAVMLPCLLEKISLRLIGGTDVPFSPPFDFVKKTLFPVIKKIGCNYGLNLIKRGYVPKGNGIVSFSSKPARLPLHPVSLTELGKLEFVEILSSSASLPKEVSRNQAIAARRALQNPLQHICSNLNAGNAEDIEFRESIESSESSVTIGSAISIFAHFSKGAVLSGSALGEKGKPAERVGEEAARNLLSELGSKQPCDSHLADQLIPFMALAKGKSELRCTKLTQHCLTNIAIVEKFLPVKFAVEGKQGDPAKISVDGAGFAP